MLAILSVLMLAGAETAASTPAKADSDPIVCKTEKTRELGSNLRRKRQCKLKSEWAMEERDNKRELKEATDRWTNPGMADGR